MYETCRQCLKEIGVAKVPLSLNPELLIHSEKKIREALEKNAAELDCSYLEYTSVVSRWADPSSVTSVLGEELFQSHQMVMSEILGNAKMVKMNVISKTPQNPYPIPFHQDISYSPENPYHYSLWLSITDSPENSGLPEFVEKSHSTIEPAVDFWSPHHVEKKFQPDRVKSFPLKRGEMLIFDSRCWHRSGRNFTSTERFAFVTRWRLFHVEVPHIPPIIKEEFGMWTCYQRTLEILKRASKHFLGLSCRKENLLDLVYLWSGTILEDKPEFLTSKEDILRNLKRLEILHRSSKLHSGGDAAGTVYRDLWITLLEPLLLKMQK